MTSIPQLSRLRNDDKGAYDRWFILSLLFLNYSALYSQRFVINYIQPPIRADLGLSQFQMDALASAFLFSYAVSQIFVGYLGDRFRRRNVLILSLTLSSLTLMGMGMAQGFYELLTLRVLLAVTQAASVPAIAGIMADCFTHRNRSRAVSLYLLATPCSLIAAGWLGGAVAERVDWRATMFVFGGIGLAVALVLCLVLREPDRTERATSSLGESGGSLAKTLLTVLRVRSFLLLAFAYVLLASVSQQLNFYMPTHFFERYGMDLEEAGFMSTVAPQIGTVVGLLVGGVLGDRLAHRWMSGRFVVQIAGLALAIPALLIIGTVESKTVILVALFVNGVGVWLYLSNLWTTTFEVVDPATRSTAVGLLNVSSGVLGSWPYLVIGRLRDDGIISDMRTVFVVYGFVLCFSVCVLVILIRKTLRRDFRSDSVEQESLDEQLV